MPASPHDKQKQIIDFWDKRAVHYDKLFWTKDEGYLDALIKHGEFNKTDLVLDVGTGTGTVAIKIKPYVNHIIGIDLAEPMIAKKSGWKGISIIRWDIREKVFADHIFDKVIARMAFHHVTERLDMAIIRCHDLLKRNGKIIVAEGMPPSDKPHHVKWYDNMFKLKEDRLTFTEKMLIDTLSNGGFHNIKVNPYFMENFSVGNWLHNSGLDRAILDKIYRLHLEAPPKIKEAYHMRITPDDIFITTRNIIFTGEK